MSSFEKLAALIHEKDNPTVMGLDPKIDYVPEFIRKKNAEHPAAALLEFNKGLIDAAADLVPAVKLQSAFYEVYGTAGALTLAKTAEYAKKAGLYVILDAKRGDIGSTAEAYAEAYLAESTPYNALTVNPYLGYDGVKPFIDQAVKSGKAIFVLVKTSNPSSADFQDLICTDNGETLYRHVARKLPEWDKTGVCGAVVGATYPAQLSEMRALLPDTFFLIPGYGAQGGRAEDIKRAYNSRRSGVVVNSSRGLMCAYVGKGDDENYKKFTRDAVLSMKVDLKIYS
jgi:orotidine-5'-phosphate decarboxylase